MHRKTLLTVLLTLLITCVGSVGGNQSNDLPLQPTQVKEQLQEDLFPKYNVPLSEDLQRYIWQQAEVKNVSYALVLAVIQVESQYQSDALSDTADYGLMQLNKYTTLRWLAKETNIQDFDAMNPYHNVTAGIWYLAYLRDYWAKHYPDEQTFTMTLLSYHLGTEGAREYVKRYGYDSEYVQKVYQAKTEIERSLK
jgi:soluble lytic murein transglycosylase-like protein